MTLKMDLWLTKDGNEGLLQSLRKENNFYHII